MPKEKLVNFFKNGAKNREVFTLGAEFEHLVVEKGNLKTVPFIGEKGVETLLQELLAKGWQGNYEDEHLIGLEKDGSTITLEPGCQLEISIKSFNSLRETEKIYLEFLRDVFPILEERQQLLLTVGYQPKSKISEIEFNPKKRYQFMAKYLKEQGKYAHNMMKGTASTQLTLDYAHQDDFRKKMRVIYALGPVMSALFDNSPVFEGETYQRNCLRRMIWDNVDDQRCVINDIFNSDFGFSDYADFVLNSAPIFIKNNEEYVYTGEKTVGEIFEERQFTIDQLEHVLTMVFPDVRLKHFIEIRMADALPYPLNMAYLAFWKGLLYSQENLDALYEFTQTLNKEDVEKAKKDIIKEGMKAKLGNGLMRELAKDLFFMATNHINSPEVHYLQPLEAIIFKELTPKEVTLNYLQEFK